MKLFTFTTLLTLCISARAQNFTVIDTLPEGAYGTAAWGDYDGDKFMDLAYLTQAPPNAICKIYHNVGNVFTEIRQQLPYLYNPAARWADLDNDGFDDLVVNGMDSVLKTRTYIYRSSGTGTFTQMPNIVFPLSAGYIDIADYNNDALKDIAVTGMDSIGINHAYIYKNTGSFHFSRINASLEGVHFGELKWGDFNHDNLPDLIINGIGNSDFTASIYKNMGSDSFELFPWYIRASGGTVDWADLDNDGWLDVFVTGYDSTSGNNFTAFNHNNKNGTFLNMATNLPDFGEPSGVEIADFDLDGKKDICFIGGSSSFMDGSAIAYYKSPNVYIVQEFFKGDIDNPIISSADMDNDGDYDLVFANFILRNNSNSTGLNESLTMGTSISVYPNPASDKIIISSAYDIQSSAIYDIAGNLVISIPGSADEVDISSLETGVYFLKIGRQDGNFACSKILVVR